MRAALLERGWEEPLDVGAVLWFEFPRSRVDKVALDEVVHPAHVFIDGDAVDEDGFLANLTITAHFACIEGDAACAHH